MDFMDLTGVGTLDVQKAVSLSNPNKQNDAYKMLINTFNLVLTTCQGVYIPYAVLVS